MRNYVNVKETMLRFSVLLWALFIAQAGAFSRLMLRHSIPFILTTDDMSRLQRSSSDGLEDTSIERLEIKELEKRSQEGALERISLTTKTRKMQIDLQPMKTIMSPNLRVTVINGKRMQEREVHRSLRDSFYHGKVDGVEGGVASLMKSTDGWKGLVFSNGEAFAVNNDQSTGEHLLMKMINDELNESPPLMEQFEQSKRDSDKERDVKDDRSKEEKSKLKLEVGVYMDQALYDSVQKKYSGDDAVITLQKLAILTINTVNIYYHKPTLGIQIEVVVAKLVIHENDPAELEPDEEVSSYLNNFCTWEGSYKNPQGLHYDVALMLTGLDVYVEKSKDLGVTGIAPFAGGCKQFSAGSCVLSEGLELAAGVVSAHEIGHSLGMSHDGDKNECPADKYIMGSVLSPGATDFSPCSKKALELYIEELDDFNNNCLRTSVSERILDFEEDMLPGERLQENEQCYYALGTYWFDDYEANSYCAVLRCWSLLAIEEPYGGPPLPGSHCGDNKICWNGKCYDKPTVDKLRKEQKTQSSLPPPNPLSLDEICAKYTEVEDYTKGAAYNKGLSGDELKGFCEKGLVCMLPDESQGYRHWNYPVPPGTPCQKDMVCKHFRCEDKDSPEPPLDSSNVTEIVSGNPSSGNGKADVKDKPIPSQTRDGIAEFCKTFINEKAVPSPSNDCTQVICEDDLYYYSVPAFLFNMCPDGQICTLSGDCVADDGKPLNGELTKEELKDADKLCKEEYGGQYQSLCTRTTLAFSLTATEYCAGGLCDSVACFAFLEDRSYSLNSFPSSYGSPCGNGDTCGLFGCGTII